MNEDRAREAVEHLQAAALEMIAAARAVLDVAEELVKDPQAAAGVISAVPEAARRASRSETQRVQRIDVS